MPDRSRSGAFALVMTLATVAGAQSPSPSSAASPAQVVATSTASQRSEHTLTLTSDGESAVVNGSNARQLAAGVKAVISSRVQGLDVVQDSGGVKLRISGTQGRDAKAPLFVVDGVPVADGSVLL